MPEREREELFHEAQKEKAGREKEERRQEKKRRTSAFRELLERTPGIKVCVCGFVEERKRNTLLLERTPGIKVCVCGFVEEEMRSTSASV